MKFILPLPPSINRTYGIGNGRMYKRAGVREWEEEAGWSMVQSRVEKQFDTLTGPVRVCITWFFKINRDIDASIKVLLDLLEKHRVYENDKQVRELQIKIFEDKKSPRVEVEIYEI